MNDNLQVLSRNSTFITNYKSNKPFTKCSNPPFPVCYTEKFDESAEIPIEYEQKPFSPPTVPIFYWEMKVIELYASIVGIGLAQIDFPTHRFPGWTGNNAFSIGYHSDDGMARFCQNSDYSTYGPTYGAGDTVGLCVDYKRKVIFFTLNGKNLGKAFSTNETNLPTAEDVEWFAALGISLHAKLEFNFGQKLFVFNLKDYIQGTD